MRDLSAFFMMARIGRNVGKIPDIRRDVWSGNPDTDRFWR